jgi:hypothetical protein
LGTSTSRSSAYSGTAGVAVAANSVALRCFLLAAQCLAAVGADDEAAEVGYHVRAHTHTHVLPACLPSVRPSVLPSFRPSVLPILVAAGGGGR